MTPPDIARRTDKRGREVTIYITTDEGGPCASVLPGDRLVGLTWRGTEEATIGLAMELWEREAGEA